MNLTLKVGIFAVILFCPLSIFFSVFSSSGQIAEGKLPLVEPLLWILLLLFLLRCRKNSGMKSVALPPPPIIAFLLVVCLSSITSQNPIDSLKEMLQCFDYYFIFFLLLTNCLDPRDDRKLILLALFLLSGAVITFAAVQIMSHGDKPFLISSLLDNRNILGSFLIILLPFCYGILIASNERSLVLVSASIISTGILINTAWVSLVVLIVPLAVMSCLNATRRSIIYFSLFAVLIGLCLVVRFSGASSRELLFETRSIEAYHDTIEKNVGMIQRRELLTIEPKKDFIIVLSTSAEIPDYRSPEYANAVEKTRQARSRDAFIKGKSQIGQRLLEWQAALNMLERHYFLGVGPGNYQKDLGYYFRGFPKLNTLEPDTQNGYLVTTASTGFIGLAVFIWMIIHFWALARKGITEKVGDLQKGYRLGILGAMLAFIMINMLYNASNHHATIVILVLLMALSNLERKKEIPRLHEK